MSPFLFQSSSLFLRGPAPFHPPVCSYHPVNVCWQRGVASLAVLAVVGASCSCTPCSPHRVVFFCPRLNPPLPTIAFYSFVLRASPHLPICLVPLRLSVTSFRVRLTVCVVGFVCSPSGDARLPNACPTCVPISHSPGVPLEARPPSVRPVVTRPLRVMRSFLHGVSFCYSWTCACLCAVCALVSCLLSCPCGLFLLFSTTFFFLLSLCVVLAVSMSLWHLRSLTHAPSACSVCQWSRHRVCLAVN